MIEKLCGLMIIFCFCMAFYEHISDPYSNWNVIKETPTYEPTSFEELDCS